MKRNLSKTWIDDEDFFKHMCDLGKKYEAIVVNKLKELGIEDIELLDDGFRKNTSEIKRFTKSSKDLKIKGWPFEVKSRNVFFTSPDDWPEKFWPMFLDTVDGFEKKDPKPVGYIFISQKTGALMAASCSRRKSWKQQRKFDRERHIWDSFYCLEKNDIMDEDRLVEKLLNMKPKK